jgi:thymidylate synthase
MFNTPCFSGSSFEEIYLNTLKYMVINQLDEIHGYNFMLTNPYDSGVINSVRKFDLIGTEKMFDWILSGSNDISDLVGKSNSDKFDSEYQGWNACYGPRVVSQIDDVIEELLFNNNTRRANISILMPGDQIIRKAMRENKTKCEYPCVTTINFFIRNGVLNVQNTLRSNNLVTTVCIDVVLITLFQEYVLKELSKHMKIDMGIYLHYAMNGHILEKDREFAKAILKG